MNFLLINNRNSLLPSFLYEHHRCPGILLVMPFCSYYLRVQDAMLGFVGSVSMLFFYTVFGTAPASWVLYVGEVVGGGGGSHRHWWSLITELYAFH